MHTFTSHFVRAARSNSGQVMLVTALLMSGMLLGATVVAGLLTVNQLRQATDVTNSARAIFAADAGAELQRYRWNKDRADCYGITDPSYSHPLPNSSAHPEFYASSAPTQYTLFNPYEWATGFPAPLPQSCYGSDFPTDSAGFYLLDGARYKITKLTYASYYIETSPGNFVPTTALVAKILGKSLNSARAFLITL